MVQRRLKLRWAPLLATLACGLTAALPAQAAGGLTLSTRFPGITVRAGEKLNLSLDVTNQGPSGIVGLEVVEVPQGWEAPVLRGAGFRVNQVYVHREKTESVNLDLKVPEQAKEGTYRVVLRAAGAAGTDLLPLEFQVARGAASRARLTTQYPAVQGYSGTTYTFRVDLANEGDSKQMFNLAAQAPKGWEVQFKPAFDSKRLATFPVDPGSSQAIDVEIRVPEEAEAGTYKIPVKAAAGNITAALELQLDLLGRYELNVTTPTGRLSAEATAGRSNPLTITVENKGSAPVDNIALSATAPPNWSVTFKPEKIDALAPGESRQVEATIKPDSRAIAGDYLVSISARSRDAAKSAEFRVGVRTSTLWGVTGAGIVMLVVAGVGWVFRTYGRR